MIITKLIGGLGNQMFQYAIGRHLSLLGGVDLKLDISGFETYTLHKYSLDAFASTKVFATNTEIKKATVPQNWWSALTRKRSNPFLYVEEHKFNFDPTILDLRGDIYLDGYWQSEKYFTQIEPIIRKDFVFGLPQAAKDLEVAQFMQRGTPISLHIRRGDYVINNTTNQIHGICTLEYYNRAIEYIASRVPDPHFFIFSDDPVWVRQNLILKYPTIYVEHNNAATNYQDLRLMASCNHHIIANSTFSWWGAWLNPHPEKIVVAPKRWFKEKKNEADLVPEAWIRI